MNELERRKAAIARHVNATRRERGDAEGRMWCAAHEMYFVGLQEALMAGGASHMTETRRQGSHQSEAWRQLAPFHPDDHNLALDFDAYEIAEAWAEIDD